MKILAAAVAVALVVSPVSGFTANLQKRPSRELRVLSAAEDPAALAEYLAKAHEAKLKAIEDVENKKNAEIKTLKEEIAKLKNGGSTSMVASYQGTPEEMAEKLLSYQKFMAKYIVEAQQDKLKAVKAAQDAAAKRYETQLKMLGGSSGAADTKVKDPTPVTKVAESEESSLFMQRNAKVSAAAKAGKSRWGELENARATKAASTAPQPGKSPATSVTATQSPTKANVGAALLSGQVNGVVATEVPPEVVAADHGLRADGGVGGFTLAERIALGSDLLKVNGEAVNGYAAPASPRVAAPSLYEKRNAMIAAAAKAGKSRWGKMEIERAKSLASSLRAASSEAAPVPPQVTAADHGLRADGGVGGPTLAERVNLGARLLGGNQQ